MLWNKDIRECNYLKSKGRITTKDYLKLVKISLRTAKRDLLSLKDKKIIKFIGPPKTGYYCFNDTVKEGTTRKANDK